MAAARKFWAEREGNTFQEKVESKPTPHDSGLSVSGIDSAQVQELQEEVRSLTERISSDCECNREVKARLTVPAQRFADYENEIHDLRTRLKQERSKNEATETTSPLSIRPVTPQISRFGSFMRKPVTSPNETPSARERELELALTQEQSNRAAAESKMREMDKEVEELSSSLFQQANDMVSAERRENAALKERIHMMEQHESKVMSRVRALEQREVDRKRRMEKLEGAIVRIERAKSLLVPR